MEDVQNDGEVTDIYDPIEVGVVDGGDPYIELAGTSELQPTEISKRDQSKIEKEPIIQTSKISGSDKNPNQEESEIPTRDRPITESDKSQIQEGHAIQTSEIPKIDVSQIQEEAEIQTRPIEISESDKSQIQDDPECPSISLQQALSSQKRKLFNCLICGKKFNQNAGRYNHMKKKHNVLKGEKTNIQCLEKGCSFKCSYKEKLQLHLVEEHGFIMDIRLETFNNYSDFLRWKEGFEKQEKTRFVKKSGSRSREKGVRVIYFYCSRSGTSINNHAAERQLIKRKLTTKSDHHCTASITALELVSGHVEVKVCATHYGHDTDLQRLRLSDTDKIQIAEQLIRGVPRDVVIDNIRSTVSSEVDRIHLITMKDIRNIEKKYGIQTKSATELKSNMTSNISNWVSLMNQSEHSPVMYFEEERSDDYANYDFTLVLMTVGQIEMAKKFVNSGIFYIPTYASNNNRYFVYSLKGKNTHEIYIATLIVVDGSNDVSPISFMITTNFNQDCCKLFFDCVKQKLPELKAKVVLTDDNSDIFEAWTSVFANDPPENTVHLWSNRFVDKDWRDNLIVIPNEEVQTSIYEKLYSYLESDDETQLCSTLKNYVDKELLTNPLTIQFGTHFVLKYLGSERFWAGCYVKKYVAIQAQLNMENLSNQIEEVVDKKHGEKTFVVGTVQDLLKLISENQCQRQAKVQRQVQDLPNHHRGGLAISPESIVKQTDTCWRVNSSKDPQNIFAIVSRQADLSCVNEPCVLFCMKCCACAHEFQCSCRLYAFDKTMCKHIHAVVQNYFDQTHFVAEEKSKATEKELVVLKSEKFWGGRKRRKRNTDNELNSNPSVKDENFLPVLDEMIHNKKRKRGRPKKSECLENEKNKKESCSEDSKKQQKTKVTVLRRSRRFTLFKSKKRADQSKTSKNQ